MIEYLNVQYDELKRTRCLDVDLEIKKHGVNACKKLLEDQGLMVVNREEYEALVANYRSLQETHEARVQEAVKAANDHNQKSMIAIQETMDLKNQAEAAKARAELNAQKDQVNMLQGRIADLRQDLKDQMQLMRDVTANNAAAVQSAQTQAMRTQASMSSR